MNKLVELEERVQKMLDGEEFWFAIQDIINWMPEFKKKMNKR